jgi:hypothetical protein
LSKSNTSALTSSTPIAPRGRDLGVPRRRPAAAAPFVVEDLEPAEQLAQLVEADRLLLERRSVNPREQRDRESCRRRFARCVSLV